MGTYNTIQIFAHYGNQWSALRPFNIKVVGVIDRAPVITGTPPASVTVGQAYVFVPKATDADGQKLTFNVQNKPAWLAFNAPTGRLLGTPTTANVGTYSNIVVSATDGSTSSSLPAFSVKVNPAVSGGSGSGGSGGGGGGGSTDKLTISGSPVTSVTAGSAYSFQPVADGGATSTMTFTVQNKPAWAAFSAATGALTGTATTGTYANIGIKVSDGVATASLAPFAISVQPPVVTTPPPVVTPPVGKNCGMQLGTAVVFCDTFDAPAGIGNGNRAGDLNGNVWGVSRAIGGGVNFGQGEYNQWNATVIQKCDGTSPTVMAPHDIIICNGQLREASNDNNTLLFDNGDVTVLAMYPKQPFDFAGRTGTVSFDVSNDTASTHSSWPEFWMSDLPVPAPYNHFDSWQTLPANGFGIRFSAAAPIGMQGTCPNGNNLDKVRWTLDSAVVVRGYVMDDTSGYGQRTAMNVKLLDCVIEPTGVTQMNHIELKIAQNQIDVYATDAGVAASPSTLKHIAVITNANLTLTRGLIWLEDAHYNADKGPPERPSQRQHTFAWDNVAFDGPFVYRDFSYDAPDNTLPGKNGSMNLGKLAQANQFSSWSVPNMPANPQGTAARVLFNFNGGGGPNPSTINVTVNGHAHSVPWPYPDQLTNTWRTFAVTVPITDLVAGTNTVLLGASTAQAFSNVNIVLVDVPGGVPVLPGANNAYP